MASTAPSSSSSTRKLVVAFFDGRHDAEDAIGRLEEAGISRDDIRFMPGDERDPPDDPEAARRAEPHGFWDALGGWFLPYDDRHTYAEGLRRGGYLISVDASDAEYERVLDILDDEGTIDMDERADSWRAEGWSGAPPAGGRATVGPDAAQTVEPREIGRRDVSHGRTRIRSYVVEDPAKSR